MTAQQGADSPPEASAGGAPRQRSGRRRPAVRWIVHGALLVALAAGVFGLLPRLGGLTHEAAGLRHARPAFLAAAVAAQAVSLGSYAQLYRRVLAALGARIRFRLAADVTLATFFVSHLTPFGSATGTLVNASTLEADGVPAATTGEAIALTSLTSTIALIVLFGTGFAATAGRHVSQTYLIIAGVALFGVAAALAAVLAVGAHPAIAGRAGRWAATVARHVRPGIDPDKAGQTSSRLASLARSFAAWQRAHARPCRPRCHRSAPSAARTPDIRAEPGRSHRSPWLSPPAPGPGRIPRSERTDRGRQTGRRPPTATARG
jgi:hypothetical protein